MKFKVTNLTIFVWLVVLFGIALRSYVFMNNQLDFYWDEVAMLVDVRSILESGRDMHGNAWYQTIFPSYGDFKLPLYIWVTTALGSVVGFSPLLIRIPNLLVGILMIQLVASFAKKLAQYGSSDQLKDSKIPELAGLWAAITLAVSPWAVHFSVTGFESHLGQFLIAVSLYILVTKQSRWSLPVAALFGVLGVYSYYAYRYIFLAVLLLGMLYKLGVSLYAKSDDKKIPTQQKKKIVTDLAIGGILALLVFGMGLQPLTSSPWYEEFEQVRLSASSNLTIEPFVHQANEYRLNADDSILDRVLFHPQMLRGMSVYSNILAHIDPQYLFTIGDANPRHSPPTFGLFPLLLAPFLVVGLYAGAKKMPKALLFLLGWWILSIIPAAVPLETPHALRSLGALVPLSIIFGIGGAYSTIWIQRAIQQKSFTQSFFQLSPRGINAVLFILVAGFLTFQGGRLIHYYTTYYRLDAGKSWQAGYSELALAALDLQNGDTPVYIAPSDDRFYLWLLLRSTKPVAEHTPFLTENFRTSSIPNIYLVNEPPTTAGDYWLASTVETQPNIPSDKLTTEKIIADSCKIDRFTLYKVQE